MDLSLAWITTLFAPNAQRVKNLFLAPCLPCHEYSDAYLGMPIVHCRCLAVLAFGGSQLRAVEPIFSTLWHTSLLLCLVALVCFLPCFLTWQSIAYALFIGCGLLLLIAWLVLELHALVLNPLPIKLIKSYDGAVILCLFLNSSFL